jgi:hypothetical protein
MICKEKSHAHIFLAEGMTQPAWMRHACRSASKTGFFTQTVEKDVSKRIIFQPNL